MALLFFFFVIYCIEGFMFFSVPSRAAFLALSKKIIIRQTRILPPWWVYSAIVDTTKKKKKPYFSLLSLSLFESKIMSHPMPSSHIFFFLSKSSSLLFFFSFFLGMRFFESISQSFPSKKQHLFSTLHFTAFFFSLVFFFFFSFSLFFASPFPL